MSFIAYDDKLYFQTGTDLRKYAEICGNNQVAVCFDNIQITGRAFIKGGTRGNTGAIMERYKQLYEKSYLTYSRLEKEVLIEIVPDTITRWEYDEQGNPYRVFIETGNARAYSEEYAL
jgi:hypothetical protein